MLVDVRSPEEARMQQGVVAGVRAAKSSEPRGE